VAKEVQPLGSARVNGFEGLDLDGAFEEFIGWQNAKREARKRELF
jgi:hypothetical protein